MSSTNYASGTVITSTWLNEVNTAVFNTLPQLTGRFTALGDFNGNAATASTAANADRLGGLPLGTNATGNVWGFVPRVGGDGVMEIGRYIDFHEASADGADSSVRLTSTGGSLYVNSNQLLHAGINRTNYKGVTDPVVVGQLMWKKFGNTHTIFDASDGTTPDGITVNPNDAAQGWTANAGRPTLMGWNGTNTYGVRVDSARVADTVAPNAVLVKPTFKGYIEQLQNLNPGSTFTVNTDNGTLIFLSLSANVTITLPPAVDGVSYTLVTYYSGAYTVTFTGGGALRWAGGSVPTATSANNRMDKYQFTCAAGYTLGQDGGRNF